MAASDAVFFDSSSRDEVERYLVRSGVLTPADLPIAVATAGAGNMNVALRVMPARGRSIILKQGRPWVAKYPHIPAPVERTLVEAAFYDAVRGTRPVAGMMPTLRHVDPANHALVLEDVGRQGDFTSLYHGVAIADTALSRLLGWLDELAAITIAADRRSVFANRAMRALNHEHIFQFPLRRDTGFDLDAITPGLQSAARELQEDRAYCEAVNAAGQRYLADGESLVHGDFFPGSWLHAGDDVRVIDPEFCFLGDREFDYGVLAAHLLMARAGRDALAQVTEAIVGGQRLNADLVHIYSGVEIMRRLIGVAQLPPTLDLERKRALLQLSRRLVLEPRTGFA